VHAQAKIDLNGLGFAVETDQGSGTVTVTLKVEGEKVTGHISNATFESDLTERLKGQALEFSFTRDVGFVIYKGTAESSDAIKGRSISPASPVRSPQAEARIARSMQKQFCCATGRGEGGSPVS